MLEGWTQAYYLILFDESERAAVAQEYGLAQMLPGYELIGLRGWDDFIVTSEGAVFTVPTVPCIQKYLKPFKLPDDVSTLESDQRFTENVKWWVTPLIFGGKATAENSTLLSHSQHRQMVRWWNNEYRKAVAGA